MQLYNRNETRVSKIFWRQYKWLAGDLRSTGSDVSVIGFAENWNYAFSLLSPFQRKLALRCQWLTLTNVTRPPPQKKEQSSLQTTLQPTILVIVHLCNCVSKLRIRVWNVPNTNLRDKFYRGAVAKPHTFTDFVAHAIDELFGAKVYQVRFSLFWEKRQRTFDSRHATDRQIGTTSMTTDKLPGLIKLICPVRDELNVLKLAWLKI